MSRCCSALIGGRCKNGFTVLAVCHGIGAGTVVPVCNREEYTGRTYGWIGGTTPIIVAAMAEEREKRAPQEQSDD